MFDDDEIYGWTTVAWEIITLQRFLIKQILWYCNIQEVAKISKNDVMLPPRKACQSNRIWMTITFFLICFSSFLLCFIQIQMTGRIIIGQIKQCLVLYFSKWLNLEPKLHIKNIVSFLDLIVKVFFILYELYVKNGNHLVEFIYIS